MKKKQPSALEKEIQQSAFAILVMMSNVDDLEVSFSSESNILVLWKNLRIPADSKTLFKALHTIHELKALEAYFE